MGADADQVAVEPPTPGDAVPGRDEVVTAAVRAADLWGNRLQWSEPQQALRDVARMSGIVALARACLLCEAPQPLASFLAALDRPLSELLPAPLVAPGDADIQLLRGGRLTDEARDLFAEMAPPNIEAASTNWQWLRAEQVERDVFRHMVATDQTTYVLARRALIELPAGTEQDFADGWNRIGWRPPDGTLTEIPSDRRAGSWWFPCPLCHWPMASEPSKNSASGFACSFPPHASSGARFLLDANRRHGPPCLRPLGSRAAPKPRRADGVRMLVRPIWRYVTIPGLAELALAGRLTRFGDVELWPDMDRMDLRLRSAGLEWEVDVKDWTCAAALAARVADSPPSSRVHQWLVVPDYRADQVPILRDRLSRWRVGTADHFVRHVRAKTRQGATP